ncbi:MAG: CvpA family protein [Firmicutes bacterium]|nr:CvpA family protein [Bacillota bacterium]
MSIFADIVIIAFIGLVIYAGWCRGFIGELSDLMIITVGSCIALTLFVYPGDFLYGTPGLNFEAVYFFSFVLVLAPVGALIHYGGSLLEKKARPGFPIPLYRTLGAMLSFIKACVFSFWILVLISMSPMPQDTVDVFKQSAVVRWVQNFEPTMENIATSAAPDKMKAKLEKTLRNSVFENRQPEKN